MKRIVYIVFLILVGIFFTSCEKVLDVDDSGAEDVLVLNGVPSAGNRAFVFFSHTHFFLDNVSSHPVDGAAPTLTVNGIPYTPDSVSGCKYFFPYICQPGDSVTIDVTSPEGNVHGKTYVPLMPEVTNFSVAEFASPSFNFYWANYTMHDHADNPEYYYLKVEVRDSGMRFNEWTRVYDTVDSVHATYFLLPYNPEITSHEVSPNEALGGYLYTSLMNTDRLIDGQDYDVNLYILLLVDTNEVNDSVHVFKHWYTITLESITAARLRYLISVAQNLNTVSFFAEPVQPFTNIEGGVGIFAGTAKWTFTFDPDTIPHVGGAPASIPIEAVENAAMGRGRP